MKVSSFVIRHSSFRRSRRGTALMAAILMLVFVIAAITAMTTLFIHEAKRTHIAVAGAQLRQLLLAAEPAAREELARNPASHDLTLPTPLTNATLTLQIQSTPNTATVRTIAKLAGGTTEGSIATSTTTYTHTENAGGGWTLQSATLTGL